MAMANLKYCCGLGGASTWSSLSSSDRCCCRYLADSRNLTLQVIGTTQCGPFSLGGVRGCANLVSSLRVGEGRFAGDARGRAGNALNVRRTRTVQISATREERKEPLEVAAKRRSLEQLDKQLNFLSGQEGSQGIPGDSADTQKAKNGSEPPLQWPVLETSFFVYTAVGLTLLTILNNVLYSIFLGPPVADKRVSFKSSVVIEPRRRITTLQEEADAREARKALEDLQRAAGDQSKQAPPVISKFRQ